MAWLNLNESLNSIKGQISNFASGVLADGIVNDTDPFTELSVANQKIQELQNLCASQGVEISSLRRQNAEFYEKIALNSKTVENNTGSNGENWFWDPPSSDVNETPNETAHRKNSTNSTISDLTKRVTDLENEKKDLIQSLEQLDSDCQRTTDKLVTLKDNLQTDYNNLRTDYDSLKNENALLAKLNEKCKSDLNQYVAEIETLKTLNTKLNSNLEELKQKNSTIQSNEINNSPEFQRQYDELKSKFNSLLEEKNMLDQTYELSKSAYSKMQTDYDKLNSDFESYKSDTIPLEKYNNLAVDYETLQKQYSEYELKSKTSTDKIDELNNKLEELKLNKSSVSQSNLSDDHKKLQDMYNELKTKHEEISSDRLEMHKKYVNILTDTVKKYVDYLIPDDYIQKPNENAEFSEFNSKVEAVLKLLLDFKWKTETLERKLCEISNEKSVAISEKNHEIEKLLHNSEILSQEVITKTQTIKHYEMECSELIKNNDLLIAELQQYKNNNGLQTISESNEDNLLLLETQLENANKRIRELELAINDMENAKQDVALETQTELDYIKKQLNMTGKELSQSKKEYQELYKTFKHYETENKNLNEEILKLRTTYDLCLNEKQNLELYVDKMKSEIENTEYKFTEANVDLETSREELMTVKNENADIIISSQKFESYNKELENKVALLEKETESLKSDLETTVEIRNQMEHQARNLTEKLQSSKMSETGLKFQNDTIKRELEIIEQKLSHTLQQLKTSNFLKNVSLDNENLSVVQKIDLLKRYLDSFEQNLAQQNQQISEKEMSSKQVILLENQISELQNQNSELVSIKQMLESNISDIQKKLTLLEAQKLETEEKFQATTNEKLELEKNVSQQMILSNEVQNLTSQLEQACVLNNEMAARIGQLEAEVNSLNISKTELVNLVTVKHQENVQYHTEIQRLNQIIAVETEKCKNLELQLSTMSSVDHLATVQQQTVELEKLTDQNNFLKEKCEKLAQNLLDEQANSQKILAERHTASDKEQSLTKELDRLRLHLVEIEDSYTKELLLAEQKNQEMLTKMNEIEQRERDSSTIYTSVNIRANQQVETLQNQLQLVTAQRDSFQNKISDAEDKINKQTAALTNLQCVLEQFQKDREKDIINETERIRRQVNVEKQKQNDLQTEINTLKAQLEESKQGLKAAARLTEQMEKSKQQVVTMKDEVTKLQDQLMKTEEKYKTLLNQTDAKVDKTLIKNLIVGFISANSSLNKDQSQILKIIATVLDFSQQDNDKLNVHRQHGGGSWLSSILHPQAINSNNSNMSQQSLSEAFVRFLESESQPKQAPPPLINVRKMSTESNASTTSSSTRQTPLLLNDVVLPTFADFAQNRNSSSILKDVLKEN